MSSSSSIFYFFKKNLLLSFIITKITAAYCESDNFLWHGFSHLKTAFWGKHIEISHNFPTYVTLKKSGDNFSTKLNKSIVQNVFIGKMYIDHYDDLVVSNHKTGEKASFSLKKRG